MFQQNRAKIGYEMLTSFPHKEGGKQWAPVEHKDKATAIVLLHTTCLEAFGEVGCTFK